mmetsp:Transcript_87481/g.271760  ORF Transcript_87481/g.271760 Transcript_87481/m.271760 type:complete len:426 (-) Transcript_87481:367-1644(-)
MVCVSSLPVATPAANNLAWQQQAAACTWETDDWSGKSSRAAPAHASQAGWQALQVPISAVQLVMCEAPPAQRAPACQLAVAQPMPDENLQVAAQAPEGATSRVDQQQPMAVSDSTKRRMRRQRAARRRPGLASAPVPGDPTSNEVGASEINCEELMEGLEAGGEARAAAVAALRGSVLSSSFAPAGCRVVQLALQLADRVAAPQLLAELHGHVRAAIESPHANYVIQKVVEVMPAALSGFVAEELRGAGAAVARHRYGCRVLCRLLEHTGSSVSLMEVLDEVLAEARDLCRHAFGHYVLQSILEHGHASHRQRLASTLRSELLEHAQHRCSSHVLESALVHCSAEDREALAAGLLAGGADGVAALARGQFSSFVVRALIRQPGEVAQATWGHLQSTAAQVQKTRHGQRLLRDLGLKPAVVAAEFA